MLEATLYNLSLDHQCKFHFCFAVCIATIITHESVTVMWQRNFKLEFTCFSVHRSRLGWDRPITLIEGNNLKMSSSKVRAALNYVLIVNRNPLSAIYIGWSLLVITEIHFLVTHSQIKSQESRNKFVHDVIIIW